MLRHDSERRSEDTAFDVNEHPAAGSGQRDRRAGALDDVHFHACRPSPLDSRVSDPGQFLERSLCLAGIECSHEIPGADTGSFVCLVVAHAMQTVEVNSVYFEGACCEKNRDD